MKNKYGIPDIRLSEIRARDKACVYCHKIMQYCLAVDNQVMRKYGMTTLLKMIFHFRAGGCVRAHSWILDTFV